MLKLFAQIKINNHGGLHNRVTHEMYLEPFTIGQCKEFFDAYHFGYNDREIAEFHMVFGGIPYYIYEIPKSEREKIEKRALLFMQHAESRKSIRITMVTALGLKHNTHSSIIQNEITLADLLK